MFNFKIIFYNLSNIYQDCIKESDGYTKDLTKINPDLSKVIMLDNSEEAVKYFLGIEKNM